jgi:hypothetical protein
MIYVRLVTRFVRALFSREVALSVLKDARPDDLFNIVAKKTKESMLIYVTSDSNVTMYVKMDSIRSRSVLAGVLPKIASDALRLRATT